MTQLNGKPTRFTQVEMVYVPKWKWPSSVIVTFHKANHAIHFDKRCPACRLGRMRLRAQG